MACPARVAAKRRPRSGIQQLTHSYRRGSENRNLHFLHGRVWSRAAEHALCEQPDRGTRRDEAFTPSAVLHKKQRIGVRGHESATLQRLRRLNCRLNQLVLNPDDPQLRVRIQKSLTGLRAAGIDVPFHNLKILKLLRPDVARILQDFEQQEQNIAIAMWPAVCATTPMPRLPGSSAGRTNRLNSKSLTKLCNKLPEQSTRSPS